MKSVLLLMKVLFSLLLLESHYFLSSVEGYSNPPQDQCLSKSICVEIVSGDEYGERINGELKCSYGVTAEGETTRCEVGCKLDTYYNCSCVSEELAKAGLKKDSERSIGIGLICFSIFVLTLSADCYRRKQYYKKVKKYDQEFEEKKEISKMTSIDPIYPTTWPFVIIEIITFIIFIIFIQNGIKTRFSNYWQGC